MSVFSVEKVVLGEWWMAVGKRRTVWVRPCDQIALAQEKPALLSFFSFTLPFTEGQRSLTEMKLNL
jgi:hypothetical protein